MSPGDVPPSFGRFQLMQVVRQDGATTLHDAFDPELGHKVALVTRPAGPDTAEEDRLAFRLCKMRHPNVVSVLDAGRQGDVAFVAAEWLETEPLSAFLARAGRIPVFQGLALVLQLLSAIDHAQARRMVHATIDLEHVQVTRTGQLKLPAGGWSLSSDRQPNLQAAARVAHVLLSGVCEPRMRRALDEVLFRAQGQDAQARFERADEFALALLSAAGSPVWDRPSTAGRSVLAELEAAAAVPVPKASATHVVKRAARKPPHRRRAGRHFLAACLATALLVPVLVGNSTFNGKKHATASAPALSLPAVAPERVAQGPVAPTPPAIEPVALAPAAPSPVEPTPIPPAPVAPSPAAPSIDHPIAIDRPAAVERPAAVAAAAAAPKRVERTATRPRSTHAHPTPPVHQARITRPAPTRVHPARPRPAPVLTAASGCPYDSRFARDLCQVQQCSRAELRHDPVCVRMLAEQRAALARLRGTPD